MRRIVETGFWKGVLRLKGDSKNLKGFHVSHVSCRMCQVTQAQMCYVSNNN